jgi:hypothetical protein
MLAILAWVWIAGLLMFSAGGAIRLRADVGHRYSRFIYVCMLWFASLPIVTGGWLWSIPCLLAGLVLAPIMIRQHTEHVRKASSQKRII